jgi:tRNA (mo5U34)-methyltransferase
MQNVLEKRRENTVRQKLESTGLYHSFRLPDGRLLQGSMDIAYQEERLASFQLPQDLRGKTVLDIGPWDGYFTFEMERRGAIVTAIDYVDLDTFRELHRAFRSKARYLRQDVYELDPANIGTFDIVLCLGALYHFKHPLLALEKICAVTDGMCIIDTYIVDGEAWQRGIRAPLPYVEFYERDELGGQLDNWSGPTVSAIEALVRAAGFGQAQILTVSDTTARVAAHRRWRALPPDEEPSLEIRGLSCHSHRGRSFDTQKEEYIALWCKWQAPAAPAIEHLFPEVDGYAVAPIGCTLTADGLLVTLRVPPGLAPGRHSARLKIERSRWSSPSEFFVDLPPLEHIIAVRSIQDGITWREDEIDWTHGGWMTLWVNGLSDLADAGNTIVNIANVPHSPTTVSARTGQVNVQLRPVVKAGEHRTTVVHRGVQSEPRTLVVKGTPPPVRGLESLTY